MSITIKVDLGGLRNIGTVLEQIQPGINAAIPLELNAVGPELFRDVVTFVGERFPDVPEPAIAAALYSIQASEVLPQYTIGAHDEALSYVRWVTLRDEKVCKICGPRDGRIYSLSDVTDIWPAHPNCRCRLERLELTEALIAGGYDALPDAMDAVAQGMMQQVERLITQFGGSQGP
jgi:SPP1 gp7 family putative phage head morphogenesis protein